MNVLKVIFIIVGVVLLLWFLIPAFLTGNPNIGSFTGIGLGILCLLYGIWYHPVNRFFVMLWRTVPGKILEIVLIVICAGILALAAATSIAMISAASNTAEPGSTVIVLGARVYKDRVSLTMANRLDAAFEYLQKNPDSRCIVSGGQGKNETVTEASMMYRYLVAKGVDESRIFLEDASTDTQENLAFSKAIIEENGLNPVVGLATDGYHEYRALKYADRAGIRAGAIPARTVWWLFPTSIVREMYGILEQWLLR